MSLTRLQLFALLLLAQVSFGAQSGDFKWQMTLPKDGQWRVNANGADKGVDGPAGVKLDYSAAWH